MTSHCDHPEGFRKDGPRMPMRWGTAATQVCTACWRWRTMLHVPGEWRDEPMILVTADDL